MENFDQRKCSNCNEVFFMNPSPVAVMLVPVDNGLLVIRRGIEPRKGFWALPGGYVDNRETWQQAGAREVFEEAGVRLDPNKIRPVEVLSTPDCRTILLFGLSEKLTAADLPKFNPSEEALERSIINEPLELAFPYHSRVAREFFEGRFKSL